ncbi:type IA DNA topoisomerase [Thiomicrolovo sp. ZZH C-3]
MDLVVVESPVKSKTIAKLLKQLGANQFRIYGTGGHIIDLRAGSFSVRLEDGKFTGDFTLLKGKKRVVDDIRKLSREAERVFICTDDDREGERIAQDVVEACSISKYYRVTFHEITADALRLALIERDGIRLIDENIVLAQWTRRMADRIIGYGLSPVLSYYFKHNGIPHQSNGIGRVIAIALGILAERHRLIEKYHAKGATVTDVVMGRYRYKAVAFDARGKKLEFSKEDSAERENVIARANSYQHKVTSYDPDLKEYPPYPPLITSSLYSGCSYLFKLDPMRIKAISQELYELGFITYPRTDSFAISDQAVEQIVAFHKRTIAPENHADILLDKREFKVRKGAHVQGAHECIRPTSFADEYDPDEIQRIWKNLPHEHDLGEDHLNVYRLIWQRAVATQLKNAVYDVSSLEITAGEYSFTTRAHNPVEGGWMKYYGDELHASTRGAGDEDWQSKKVELPKDLYVGLILESVTVDFYESHSHAPKRISEGALIKMLEGKGIARPSTLHTISHTLKKKGYAKADRSLLSMLDPGLAVYDVADTHLAWLTSIENAQLFEEIITAIEEGVIADAHEVLMVYWKHVEEFKETINYVEYSERAPTPAQVDAAEKLIARMTPAEAEAINPEIYSSQEKMSLFLDREIRRAKEREAATAFGHCPNCGKPVIEKEQLFACSNGKCKFALWKNALTGFFERFGVQAPDLHTFVEMVLTKEVVRLEELRKKDRTRFSPNVIFSFDKKHTRWGISFTSKPAGGTLSLTPLSPMASGESATAQPVRKETAAQEPVQKVALVLAGFDQFEKDLYGLAAARNSAGVDGNVAAVTMEADDTMAGHLFGYVNDRLGAALVGLKARVYRLEDGMFAILGYGESATALKAVASTLIGDIPRTVDIFYHKLDTGDTADDFMDKVY